jgi:hypothetical protein
VQELQKDEELLEKANAMEMQKKKGLKRTRQ